MSAAYCEIVRRLVESTAADLEHYVERLKSAGRGWWPESLAIRDLDHSSRVLRLVAAEIDNAREAMIQQERVEHERF